MFGKMMNNYYYGKSGKGDYTKEDLPSTRWQLFWEMLKIRLSGLFRINLMYMVAWLPSMIVILMAVMSWYSGVATLAEAQASLAAGETTAEAVAQLQQTFTLGVQALVMRTLLFLIPCLLITGPCTAGLCYVTRNWARDEHAFVWGDFKDAIKENWKQALGVSAITAVMPTVVYVCWVFYGEQAKQSALFAIPQMLSLLLVAFWMMSLLYTYPLMVTYKLRFRDLIRNSFLLTIGRLPQTVGFKLLSLVPAAIGIVVSLYTPYFQWAVLGVFLYYVLIGFSLSRFIHASYSNAVFDRFINSKIDGAEVGRGLYHEEDDDEEEDDASGPDDHSSADA